MKVKICGITNLADARYATALGADYLGFILHPESPRYVEARTAAEIIEWVYGATTVGVFVDADADTVNSQVAEAGFDMVQLHGDETIETCARIEQPIIKAFQARERDTFDDLARRMEPYAETVDFFLVDTYDASLRGGTGRTFDWTLASRLAGAFPLFLAGGLRPENVVRAVETVSPAGVDVSSGVESEPGRKDFARLDAFFDALSRSGLIENPA